MRWSAWSWPGTIETIGPSHSGGAGREADRPAREVQRRVVVRNDHQLPAELVAQASEERDQIRPPGAPDRTTARTGTPGSTSVSGPCWKSAEEYGSAKTAASSLSLSAHSRAVAYSKPRAMTSARVAAAWSARDPLDLGLELERARERFGDGGDGGAIGRIVGERGRQEGDREQLGGVGLGRGDRPFRAGAQGDRPIGGGRQRRIGLVGDRDRRGALGPRRGDDRDDRDRQRTQFGAGGRRGSDDGPGRRP